MNTILNMAIALDAGIGGNRGILAAANENRFEASHLSEGLTAYVQGLPEDPVEAALQAVAPANPAPRRFEYRSFGKDTALLTEDDDVRAIGSAFKKISVDQGTVNSKTLNKGLTITLDKDELGEGDEEAIVAMIRNRLSRNDLARVITLLDTLDTSVAKNWASSTTTPPDSDLMDSLTLGGDALGVDLNTVVFGGSAWNKRFAYYEASNNSAPATLSTQDVARRLMVDRVEVINHRQRTAKAGAKSAMLGDFVYMYYTGAATRFDPSHIKRFVTGGAGGNYEVYREEHAKTIDISVSHYSTIASAMTAGVRRIVPS